jgi:hypothetical protein
MRARVPRLHRHAACYALLLAVVTAVIPLDASFGADDGAYGGQVFALLEGDWALARPLLLVDQANEGWFNTAITPGGPTPYTANPAYALLLRGTVELVHDTSAPRSAGSFALGLQLVPVIGALLSACVAWLLAARWSATAAPVAFWLLGLGPVLVNSTTFWAHTLSTALGGAALLAVVALAERPGIRRSNSRSKSAGAKRLALRLGFAASLVAAAAVRTEAIMWTVAVSMVAVLVDRSRAMAATVVAGGGAGLVAWVANRSWGRSLRAGRLPIETSIDVLSGESSWLESRVPAAWQLLMTSLDGGQPQLLALAAVTMAGWAAVKLRGCDDGTGLVAANVVLVAAALTYLARMAIAPGEVITGAVAAWPLLAVLLVATIRSPAAALPPGSGPAGQRPDHSILLLAPSGLLLLQVVLTQYSGSGGLQWGGRYLSMCFAPLAAAAAIRGEALFQAHRRPMLALLVVPAAAGIVASYQLHSRHRSVVEAVTAQPSEVVVTEIPALPRIGWTALPTAFYVADPASVEPLLVQLAGAGVPSVNVHGLDGTQLDGTAGFRLSSTSGDVRHLVRSAQQTGSP